MLRPSVATKSSASTSISPFSGISTASNLKKPLVHWQSSVSTSPIW